MGSAYRVYIGNLPQGVNDGEIEDEFARFGRIRNLWVARKPAGFAFLEYEDPRDADDAIKKLNGHKGWKVELSRKPGRPGGYGGGGGGYGGDRGGSGDRDRGGGYDRDRDRGGYDRGRSPPRRRSPTPERYRRRSPSYERGRSPPRRRSPSPARDRSRERSRDR